MGRTPLTTTSSRRKPKASRRMLPRFLRRAWLCLHPRPLGSGSQRGAVDDVSCCPAAFDPGQRAPRPAASGRYWLPVMDCTRTDDKECPMLVRDLMSMPAVTIRSGAAAASARCRLRVGASYPEHDEHGDRGRNKHANDAELPDRPAFGKRQLAAGARLQIDRDECFFTHAFPCSAGCRDAFRRIRSLSLPLLPFCQDSPIKYVRNFPATRGKNHDLAGKRAIRCTVWVYPRDLPGCTQGFSCPRISPPL